VKSNIAGASLTFQFLHRPPASAAYDKRDSGVVEVVPIPANLIDDF
jgi:hypothetical protein